MTIAHKCNDSFYKATMRNGIRAAKCGQNLIAMHRFSDSRDSIVWNNYDRARGVNISNYDRCHRPNIAIKLFLLPTLCILLAFRSITLCAFGIAGKVGGSCVRVGLGILLPGVDWLLGTRERAGGLRCVAPRLDFLCGGFASPFVVGGVLDVMLLIIVAFFCKRSICPRIVVPEVARYSSGMPMNLTTPRSGNTPREEAIKDWVKAVFRLLVVAVT